MHYTVNINATRNFIRGLSGDQAKAATVDFVKILYLPKSLGTITTGMIPDILVTDEMIRRFNEITPPIAAVIPEFQIVIEGIEAD